MDKNSNHTMILPSEKSNIIKILFSNPIISLIPPHMTLKNEWIKSVKVIEKNNNQLEVLLFLAKTPNNINQFSLKEPPRIVIDIADKPIPTFFKEATYSTDKDIITNPNIPQLLNDGNQSIYTHSTIEQENSIEDSNQPRIDENREEIQGKENEVFTQALDLFNKGFYKESIPVFNRALQQYPESELAKKALLNLAQVYEKLELFYEAEAIYTQFIEKYPDHPLFNEIMIKRAEILLAKLEDSKKAKHLLVSVLYNNPEELSKVKALFFLGNCYAMGNQYAKAYTYYKEAFSQIPEYAKKRASILYYAAQTYFQNNDLDFAREILHYLINLYPSDLSYTPQGFALLGDIYKKWGNMQVALNMYQEAINKYPNSLGALISKIRMADINLSMSDDISLKDLIFSYESFYNSYAAYEAVGSAGNTILAEIALMKLGLALLDNHKYENALKVFKKLLKWHPHSKFSDDIHISLQVALFEWMKLEFQEEHFIELLTIFKTHQAHIEKYIESINQPKAYLMPAKAYAHLGLLDEAEELYKKVEHLIKEDPDLYYQMGQLYLSHYLYEKAEDYFNKIIKKFKKYTLYPTCLHLLGDISYFLNKDSEGVTYYKKALSFDALVERQILSYRRLGLILKKQSSYKKALEAFQKLLEITPEKNEKLQSEIYLSIGDCYYQLGNYQDGLDTYNKIKPSTLNNENFDWLNYSIAKCYLHLNNEKKAEEYLSYVYEKGHDFLLRKLSQLKLEIITEKQNGEDNAT
ncbi:MAG: tetratricopeptide repeat protein [bacterium]